MLLLSLILLQSAFADSHKPVFQGKAALGTSRGEPVFRVNPMVTIGDAEGSHYKVDLAFSTNLSSGKIEEVDGKISRRYLPQNKRIGYEASLFPFRYRRDENYYEISLIEVSAVMRLAEGKGHQVLASVGINPITKRTYDNDLSRSLVVYDPVAMGAGYFSFPDYARVYGALPHYYDSNASGTWADNSTVYFGGGQMTRAEETSYDTSEFSARVPVSLEYQYQTNDKRVTVYARAYYALRMGADTLDRVKKYDDLYEGFVSYSNVYWGTCYDSSDRSYACNPIPVREAGAGYIHDYHSTRETLDSRGFLAHSVGAKGEVTYSVYKSRSVEALLSAEASVDYDSHLYDATYGLGETKNFTRIRGLAGGIVRF